MGEAVVGTLVSMVGVAGGIGVLPRASRHSQGGFPTDLSLSRLEARVINAC